MSAVAIEVYPRHSQINDSFDKFGFNVSRVTIGQHCMQPRLIVRASDLLPQNFAGGGSILEKRGLIHSGSCPIKAQILWSDKHIHYIAEAIIEMSLPKQ